MIDVAELYPLLPKFKERFFYGANIRWNIQKARRSDWELGFTEPKSLLTDQHLIQHFSQQPVGSKGYIYGSISIKGKFENDRIKWVVFDADNEQEYSDLFTKLLPILDKYKIEYIIEHSSENRCHIWIFCDSQYDYINVLMKQIVKESDTKIAEVFPLHAGTQDKSNATIRMLGGFHIKNKKANPIEYKGSVSSNPLFILKTICSIKILDENSIKSMINVDLLEKQKRLLKTRPDDQEFQYLPRNLETRKDLPPIIETIASNCQAARDLINECYVEDILDVPGNPTHNTGFYLAGLAKYNDAKTRTRDGKIWFERLLSEHRFRDARSHVWMRGDPWDEPSPKRFVAGCNKWEPLGKCEGCPFRGQLGFNSPRQFIKGKTISKEKIGDPILRTAQEIQEDTFVKAKERIHQLLSENKSADILLGSPQSTGKSYLSDKIIANLARLGKYVMLAVPTGELAIEHKNRIEAYGQKAFVLMSHKNWFSKWGQELGIDFSCPKYDEIQNCINLGASSGSFKKKYCSKCPFLEKCPYPNQYANSQEEDYKVVIIQHAHFAVREALFTVLQKRFDVLFVDESFIDTLKSTIKPQESEIEILKQFQSQFPWTTRLVNWFEKGGYPQGEIKPLESQLEQVYKIFEANMMPWNIPNYRRGYNLGDFYNPKTGLFIFTPVPEIPIRVFTDATPPLKMLKIILNNENIEVFGEGEILDYRKYNPQNKIIQVLDSSLSQTSLEKDDKTKLYDILEFIGDSARFRHPNDKILITVYRKHEEEIKEWLIKNYPDIIDRLKFNNLTVGSNAYLEYNVQFLIAGVYMIGKSYVQETYELKSIYNYWAQRDERKEIKNMFPYHIHENEPVNIKIKQESVIKIEPDGIYQYPGHSIYPPSSSWHNMIYDHNIGITQQAIRLRFPNIINTDPKAVYIFGNYNFPSLLITDVMVLDQILGSNRQFVNIL